MKDKSWYNRDEQMKTTIFENKKDELLKLELDDLLRFDFNIIWDAGASTPEMAQFIKNRLHILHLLAQGKLPNHYTEANAITMSNQYRVLKFLKNGARHPASKGMSIGNNGAYGSTGIVIPRI